VGWWKSKNNIIRRVLVGWKFIGLSIFRKPYRSPSQRYLPNPEHLQEFANFYFANFVFCQLLKRYIKLKRSSSTVVWHNSLAKFSSNIRNLREKQNYVYALTPLEKLHEEPSFVIFSSSHMSRKDDINRELSAYFYALKVDFSQIAKIC
jgi:hypothetical protein